MGTIKQGGYCPDPKIVNRLKDPARGYKVWNIKEIYFGTAKDKLLPGLNVPNVGDLIHEYQGNILIEWRVIGVDESTDIPELKRLSRVEESEDNSSKLIAIGNGATSELHRIFFDKKVVPHTLMVDAGVHFYGEQGMFMKLFRANPTTPTATCISMYRDNNSNRWGENVPLVTLGNRFDDSSAIKRPTVFHTTEELKLGDVVTAVIYTAEGFESARYNFIVAYGANVRDVNASTHYVTNVELDTPFLSPSDDRLLVFPSNVVRDALFTRAKITYSDERGEQYLAIDGDRIRIIGLENYIGTINGETNELGLVYNLGENELALNASSGESRHITTLYRYRTGDIDGDYTAMLNVIPHWVNDAIGWELKYYYTNLDRSMMLDVTHLVEAGANTDLFDGKRYGKIQRISVVLNLAKLELGLKEYRHVQAFTIGLMGSPLNYDSPFKINYHATQELPYGEFCKIKLKTTGDEATKVINLNEFMVAKDFGEFLDRTLYAMKPLYDQFRESRAPKPTHFIVKHPNGTSATYPVSKWSEDLEIPVSDDFPLNEGATIEIEWVEKIGPVKLLRLATTPFIPRY